MDSITTYAACDRCFTAHATHETELEREVIGGDGAMCSVMLCDKCLLLLEKDGSHAVVSRG